MNWADYIILAVVGLSVLIGLWRGLISEVLGLVVWALAFWVAWMFGPAVAGYFEHSIQLPSARMLVGYGICFLVVLIAGALLRFLVSKLVEGTGLSGTDRLLGMLFGFARGVLLVTLAVFLLGFTAVIRDPWWNDSVLLPQFKGVAAWLGEQVPDSVRHHLNPPALLDHLPALPAVVPGASPATEHKAHPAATSTAATATSF
ncbi:CvpA family protein [Dyella halodurans]|uniref:CvpA family protein n=1 Tax=Dyella halodurans TaxID=1920171 RepID=A0ABV9C441_9GAMM|nr:CvpA family protein [Dyella halodurans]